MAYNATKLATEAFYLTGIVSRDFETVSGSQIEDGIELLNDILGLKSVAKRLIPFYQEYTLTAIKGQEAYDIPGLVDVETITFNIDNVRYSMTKEHRVHYFGSPRADNIESLPMSWHLERQLDGSKLYLYFLPDDTYPIKIWGKFALSSVTNFTDLSLTYERNYIVYLKYQLAAFICDRFNTECPSHVLKVLEGFSEEFKDISPIDLRLQKLSYFPGNDVVNYAQVNLGKGWTT
jgi:hypothetical protein